MAYAGNLTTYVCGADGTRLKKIVGGDVTAYFGPVEIRHFGQGAGEEVLSYPHASVRLVDGVASYLHGDQLGSVRTVTDAAGGLAKRSTYRPFGEISDWGVDPATLAETKGFVGERFDADAGLQYLNARYFDPQLALFLQPDWFEVTEAGVGTNRYAYSLNDPVNASDPSGNEIGLGNLISNAMEAQSLLDSGQTPAEAQQEIARRETKMGLIQSIGILGLIGSLLAPEVTAGLVVRATARTSPGFVTGAMEVATSEATGMTVAGGGAVATGATVISTATKSARATASKASAFARQLSSGSVLDRNGLTKVGRAIQKHGDRKASAFPRTVGSAAAKNRQGQTVLEEILRSENRVSKSNRFGGVDIFDQVTGRGARFDSYNNFKGFLEP